MFYSKSKSIRRIILSAMLAPALIFMAGTCFAGLLISMVQSLDYFPLIGKTTLSLRVYIDLFHSAIFYRSLFFLWESPWLQRLLRLYLLSFWHSGFDDTQVKRGASFLAAVQSAYPACCRSNCHFDTLCAKWIDFQIGLLDRYDSAAFAVSSRGY